MVSTCDLMATVTLTSVCISSFMKSIFGEKTVFRPIKGRCQKLIHSLCWKMVIVVVVVIPAWRSMAGLVISILKSRQWN